MNLTSYIQIPKETHYLAFFDASIVIEQSHLPFNGSPSISIEKGSRRIFLYLRVKESFKNTTYDTYILFIFSSDPFEY